MADIRIITEKCVGCRLCVKACPFNAIEMIDKKAVILDTCTLCGVCVSSCKFDAIDFKKDEVKGMDISAYKGVWVFGEQSGGVPAGVALELLGEGRKLADELHESLSAVLIGTDVEQAAKTQIAHVVDADVALVRTRMHGDAHRPGLERNAAEPGHRRPWQIAPVAQLGDGVDVDGELGVVFEHDGSPGDER